MNQKLSIQIWKEGKFFIAKCLELGVVSQGLSYGEAINNIREAVELYLEDETKPVKTIDIATIEVPIRK